MVRAPVMLATLVLAAIQGAEEPRAIVHDVTAAVQAGDTAGSGARWAAVHARDPASSAARLALATLARLTYDYSAADSLYRGLFVGRIDPRVVPYARLGLSEALYEQGRLGEIEGLLRTARAEARSVHDSSAEGEALAALARVRTLSQGVETGLALIDTGFTVAPRRATDVRSWLGCLRAQFMTVLGAPHAPDTTRTALIFARRAGAPRAEAVCLRALSLEHRFAGRADSSFAVLQELEALRRRTRDRSRLAEALFLQGDVLQELAAYGRSSEVLHQALAEARASQNLYIQASVNLGLAALYFRLNDAPAAGQYVNQAVVDYQALADTGGVMMARSWRMQLSIEAGDFDGAVAETDTVIRFFHREGDVTHESELYQTLADIAIRGRRWPAAEQAIAHAEALLRGHSSAAANATLPRHWGRLALARGDLETADREFRRYFATLPPDEHLRRSETRGYLAEIEARRGRFDLAERDLLSGEAELDRWRAGLADRDLRALAFQASPSEANDRNSSIARALSLLAANGRAAAAFEVAEHRRARDLSDRMRRAAAANAGMTEERTGASDGPAVVAADSIVAALPDTATVLVEYVTGAFGAPTTAFVLGPRRGGGTRAQVRAVALAPADSLTERIGRLVETLQGGSDAPALARDLDAVILEPIVAGLGPSVTNLVIVPDGPLHRLPFDALRLPDGRHAVERFAISTAPSSAILVDLWKRDHDDAEARDPVRMLAMGDPAFPSTNGAALRDVDDARVSGFQKSGGLPRLRGSAREVRQVARYADLANIRTGAAASAAYLKHADLLPYRIVHLATHALVDEYAVARTALVLAPGRGESGFVGSGELAELHLAADLVVLSACRTAGGVVVDGEGILGLSGPLLQAGARSIVATGWTIGDRATMGLMDAFYDELAAGLPEGAALRAAKLRMIHEGRPASQWAAFTLVGDPAIRLRLSRPGAWSTLWVSAAALAMALAALAGWRWTRRQPGQYNKGRP